MNLFSVWTFQNRGFIYVLLVFLLNATIRCLRMLTKSSPVVTYSWDIVCKLKFCHISRASVTRGSFGLPDVCMCLS